MRHAIVSSSGGIAAFWPPNGLVIALFLLLRGRSRLVVAAAVVPAEVALDAHEGFPLLAALGWGATNLVESLLVAVIIARLVRGRPFGGRQTDFLALATAAFGVPLVSGLIGGLVGYAYYGGSYRIAWMTWWLGDATGILLVTPLALALGQARSRGWRSVRPAVIVEVALVAAVTGMVFGLTDAPVGYFVLPPLVFVATTGGLAATASAAVSVAIVGTILTGHGYGSIAQEFKGSDTRGLILQGFIGTMSLAAYLICGMTAERRETERELEHLATHDPLTGLANGRLFFRTLEHVIARGSRSSEAAAVLYLDLDGFKAINDDFGHAAGDAVLAEIARRLEHNTRRSDLVARLGGDEFAAILDPVDGLDDARRAARRLVERVAYPVEFGDRSIPAGLSVGAALAEGTAEACLHDADRALYSDKQRRTAAPR